MHIAAWGAVAIMIGSTAWQMYGTSPRVAAYAQPGRGDGPAQAADEDLGFFEAISNSSATSSTKEEVAHLGPNIASQIIMNYAVMQGDGTYTPESAARMGQQMAAAAQIRVEHPIYEASALATTPDISSVRVERYKQDIGEAFKPLAAHTRPEFEPLALYVETKDTAHLDELRMIAGAYRTAATQAAGLVVPADVASIHAATLNAMQAYAAVIEALADNADNPITTAALLVSFNNAENELRAALGAYGPYYASK